MAIKPITKKIEDVMEEKYYKITKTNLKNLLNNFLNQYNEGRDEMVLIDDIEIKEVDDGIEVIWGFTEILITK